MRLVSLVRGTALLAAAAALAGCYPDKVDIITAPATDALFQSYVALGNSITAGYQSGGINDSTQQESYAALLARQSFKTRYAYASLALPGCTPPTANFLTGALVGGAPAGFCALRAGASLSAVLNNVAVPGATSFDPTSASTGASNQLTTFILGGKTQVQKAADAEPTFVSVWIGNNDVLDAAVKGSPVAVPGLTAGATAVSRFQANYAAMLNGLRGIPSLKGGVLIGVVQTAAAPILFPAAALANPAVAAGLAQAVGSPVVIHPGCMAPPGNASLVSFAIVQFLRTLPAAQRVIACTKNAPGVPPPLGDYFILDVEEQAALTNTVNEYNAYIRSQADAMGWAYVDPNPSLLSLKQSGCVSTVPNLASARPFGDCISLDGVHPARAGHVVIANAVVAAINAKYGKSLPTVK